MRNSNPNEIINVLIFPLDLWHLKGQRVWLIRKHSFHCTGSRRIQANQGFTQVQVSFIKDHSAMCVWRSSAACLTLVSSSHLGSWTAKLHLEGSHIQGTREQWSFHFHSFRFCFNFLPSCLGFVSYLEFPETLATCWSHSAPFQTGSGEKSSWS